MNYTDGYNDLRQLFNSDVKQIDIPWSGVRINNLIFRSEPRDNLFLNTSDKLISENESFSYPVFSPSSPGKKVILLLHGLNERSWVKYLTWAHWLAENTSSYVVLFPISFHINRSPESWKDPRSMVPVVHTRNSMVGNPEMLSFANVALSNRLTEDPMRFLISGQQTASDLVRLLKTIQSGNHELIPGGCKLNIFAYSIGAFLAEILMLSDPEALFSESKLFIFCGGSVFSNMNGRSKLIMDSHAFDKVYKFYLNDFEDNLKKKSRISEFLLSTNIGMAFRSMIDRSRLKSFRESGFRKLRDQIRCIILRNDIVIPPAGVIDTLRATGNSDSVRLFDFPFSCSHENPFPVFHSHERSKVDMIFEMVFSDAATYLC